MSHWYKTRRKSWILWFWCLKNINYIFNWEHGLIVFKVSYLKHKLERLAWENWQINVSWLGAVQLKKSKNARNLILLQNHLLRWITLMLQIYQISFFCYKYGWVVLSQWGDNLKKKKLSPPFQKNPYLKDIIKWHIFMSTDVLDWWRETDFNYSWLVRVQA